MGGGTIEAADPTEADITEDVPSGSRQLSVWLRRTRQNKVRKIVREVYLRDDIIPEVFEGADQILVLDTNIVLHQLDFIAEDECVNHVVIPYTVLQEVRARNLGTYARLRALCRVDLEDAKAAEAAGDEQDEPTAGRRGRGAADMSKARNARRFYVFPNEFFRETYVERNHEESVNDRNDRAIRRVAHWYRRQVVGPEVLLLTDDRACKAKATADGLDALTARDFVERSRARFPNAGEKLAFREEEERPEGDAATPAAPARGQKRKAQRNAGPRDGAVYPAHLKASEVERRLRERSLVQGVVRMGMNTCMFGFISASGDEDIMLSGRLHLNRAVDGDVVAVERLGADDQELAEPANKKLRLAVTDSEFGATGEEPPSAVDEQRESGQKAAKGKAASDGRQMGRVVGIIRRNWREYAGTLRPLHAERQAELGPGGYGAADRIFVPTDARVPNVTVQTRHSTNLEGKRIVVVIDGWDRYSHQPRGHWTKILGDVGDRSVESAVILHEHGVITREFGEAVLRCLPPADFTPGPKDVRGREDLRGICVCSIDPPGCKDIDDALSCEQLKNGNYRVGVHIADVTHFVHPDTAVDKEAAERCTTVYLVEKRTDMLPGLLTTDICSLRGGVERLTFSVLWEMTKDAEIVSTRFCKAIIKSNAALSYAEAQARIDDPSDKSGLTTSIRTLNNMAKIIRAKRVELGALELASQEVKFELDSETQDPTDVAEYQQRETNKLVEEFMLLANQSVATKILNTFPMFAVLRRHPAPKDEALKTMKKLLDKHGIDFKFSSNKELAKSLDDAVNPKDPYFNTLVRMMATRCMNQAVYFCTGEVQPALYGHYGLAMELYTHFTSPIRRYADVLVHRLLAASLGIATLPESLQSKPEINEQCDKINLKHRSAQFAGRASADLHTFLYFKNKGKMIAEAVVTRVRKGMQVVVPRYGIEGVVALPEEEWDINEDEQYVASKKDDTKILIFTRIVVEIEADNTDFRNKTLLTFQRVATAGELEAYEAAEEARKKVQQEMFPDRLVREAN